MAHKTSLKRFVRQRILTFPLMVISVLRKSVKSMQVCLNELFQEGWLGNVVSKSAYSRMRKQLKHTAFVALNSLFVKEYYAQEDYKRWRGYRLLGVDGSRLILPKSSDILSHFGSQRIPQTQHCEEDVLPCGILSVCYDVLNEINLHAVLGEAKCYEVTLAKSHEKAFGCKDIVLFDRHYAGFEFIAWLSQQPCDFIIRCSNSTFLEGQKLFKGGPWRIETTLSAPGGKIKQFKKQGLPRHVTVNFIRVILPTGETEVLVTSLKDKLLTADDFLMLYGYRWKIETYYERLKERLNLENFTVKHTEGVLQDIYATLLIANLETLLTEDIDNSYAQQSNGQQKKVNKAISFNVIKHQVFNLFYDPYLDMDTLIEKMEILFKQSPTHVRPGRQVERGKSGPYRKLRFLKTRRKICF